MMEHCGLWVIEHKYNFCTHSHTHAQIQRDSCATQCTQAHHTDFSHHSLSVSSSDTDEWLEATLLGESKNQQTSRAFALCLPGSLDLITRLHTSMA